MSSFKERLAALKAQATNLQETPEHVEELEAIAEGLDHAKQVASFNDAVESIDKALEAREEKKLSFAERVALAQAKAASSPSTVAINQAAVSSRFADRVAKAQAERIAPKAVADQQLKAYLDPKATSDRFAPKPLAATKLELATLIRTFRDQRFTAEEAQEEAEAIIDLCLEDPELEKIWLTSSIPLNSLQLKAVALAMKGINFVLTGAAGTGKTTAQAAVVEVLDNSGQFHTHDFKYIGTAPSIAICAFTKVAVRNIQKAIKKNERISHYSIHCMTIHSLLEFEPVIEDRRNEETDELYQVRIFKPQRTSENPLTLTHLIIEEASMVGLDLWRHLWDALTPGVQIIFLGDINQLQPVFSKPILGYALVKLPVIQLKRVYRQALDNPIIFNAHRVLRGEPILKSDDGKVRVVYGAKEKMGQHKMAMALPSTFRKLYQAGDYDPEQDMILLPWNKQDLGVTSMNEKIATILSGNTTPVYCVQGGMNKWYLAVGDKVLVDKRQGKIIAISPNPKYVGGASLEPSFVTRDGTPILTDLDAFSMADEPEDATTNIDYSNFSLENVEEDAGLRASTHIVRVEWADTPGAVHDLTTSGDFGQSYFQLGYCMTVHKAQGSEWRQVFVIVHFEHKAFLTRELMYTALTRAREVFTIFGDAITIELACKNQAVLGDSLEDKINYFNNGALPDLDVVPCSKGEDEANDWLLPYGSA